MNIKSHFSFAQERLPVRRTPNFSVTLVLCAVSLSQRSCLRPRTPRNLYPAVAKDQQPMASYTQLSKGQTRITPCSTRTPKLAR